MTTTLSISRTTGYTLANDDRLIIADNGNLNTVGTAITWNLPTAGSGLQIENNGRVVATNGAAIEAVGNAARPLAFSLVNQSGATIESNLEAINIGGGRIENYGLIKGDQRAIHVNSVDETVTTIINTGTIRNLSGFVGEAIRITGAGNDVVDNAGSVFGNVFVGAGDDIVTNYGTINTLFTESGDDTINVKSGSYTKVNGGLGFDIVNADFSSQSNPTDSDYITIRSDLAGGFFGEFRCYSRSGSSIVNFESIEQLRFVATDRSTKVDIDAASLKYGGRLFIDGGGGSNDELAIDMRALDSVKFAINFDGSIDSTYGEYINFENATVRFGSGDNMFIGAALSDIVFGGTDRNLLNGGGGNDTIVSRGVDQVDGGLGVDLWAGLYGDGGSALEFSFFGTVGTLSNGTSLKGIETYSITTGDGNDTFFVGFAVSACIDGGQGTDTVTLLGDRDGWSISRSGTGYRLIDVFLDDGDQGTVDVINIELVKFDDRMLQLDDDILGVDLIGSAGVDYLLASDFNDRIDGLGGNDTLYGLIGADVLTGGAGNDLLDGGTGIDTATYIDSIRGVTVNLAITTAQFTGDGKDTLISIENLVGSAFADGLRGDGGENILDGAFGNDNLFGFGGADTLIGGEGADRLDGGDGADILRGGLGRDTLTGGAGSDRFVFDTLAVTPQPDTIRDFASGIDEIALSKSVFAALTGGTFATSAFHVGTRATTVDQHIIYNSATGALFYDADGVGGTAQIQIAQLTARPMIDANDFILI